MIDLGVELAHYGEEPKREFRLADLHGMRLSFRQPPVTVPLADLQAQGFNTEPPPWYRVDERKRR